MSDIIEGVSHVNAQELHRILQDPDQNHIYVIDVREPEEYAEGHIPGVPLLPMGDIPDVVDRLDKSAEYVLVCRSGRRSLEVAKFFQSEGIEKVHNYLGGMLAWDQEIAQGLEKGVVNSDERFSMNLLERNG